MFISRICIGVIFNAEAAWHANILTVYILPDPRHSFFLLQLCCYAVDSTGSLPVSFSVQIVYCIIIVLHWTGSVGT